MRLLSKSHYHHPCNPTSASAAFRRVAAAMMSGLACACGAATALDFDPPTKDKEAQPQATPAPKDRRPSESDREPSQPGNTPGKGADAPIDLPSFDLPDCKPGAKPNSVAECPYLAEGLCYEDVESACACVCPRRGDTFCFEGLFLNEWNGVDVWCSER